MIGAIVRLNPERFAGGRDTCFVVFRSADESAKTRASFPVLALTVRAPRRPYHATQKRSKSPYVK